MGKISHLASAEEILFASSDSNVSNRIRAWLANGEIRKIAPKIYSTNLEDEASVIIQRNWYKILAHQYSGMILSHRSALEYRPYEGHIYLTGSYKRRVELPGLVIHLQQGPGPLDDDNPFHKGLLVSSEARALLENLQPARRVGDDPGKAVSQEVLEQKLEAILKARGEEGLNQLRDHSRKVSQQLGMEDEFAKLDRLISSLLTTGDSKYLKSDVALARAKGLPIDSDRIQQFEILADFLLQQEFAHLPDRNIELPAAYRNFGFFEAYFSNYIEGTEFDVDEAKEIITTNTPIPTRDEDSHDILGTYAIVSNKKGMSEVPANPDEMLELLRRRHSILLSARTSKKPGIFKDKNNRAGNTEFVDHQLVTGTLQKGFEYYQHLRHPFARAAYMKFLISEVHPFLDGNGRIARVMMNAELTHSGLSKIIIPTVYREDYMGALKHFTKNRTPEVYVRMLYRAYQFSATIFGTDIDQMEQYLRTCNAFSTPKEGKLTFDVPQL